MATDPDRVRSHDTAYALLIGRISYLEHLRACQQEMARIIRVYSSNETIRSERGLQEIVNYVSKKFDLQLVSVLLVEPSNRHLQIHVSSGGEETREALRDFLIPLNEGLCGACVKEGIVLTVQDVTKDARYLRGPLDGAASEMCVPIKIKHRVVGVLDLQDLHKGRFDKDLVQIIEDVSLSIGFILETQRLYTDLKLHNEELEKKVDEKIYELKKSEERYRMIVENAANPLFVVDLEGHFCLVNRAVCAQLGYPREEMVGLNISKILKKGSIHKFYHALRDALDGREVKSVQIEVLTRNGDERTVEFTCHAVQERGHATGVEGMFRDMTDRAIIEKLKKNYMKSLEEAVIERTAEIKETQRAAILAMAFLAESIDDNTGGHLERIRHYSKVLADELRTNSRYRDQITEDYVEMIYDLSPLHDLGKVGIRDYILQKPDQLTQEEFKRMKDHSEIGARALSKAGEMIHRESIFSIGEMIARFHHEKWDGTGYPAVEINGEIRPLRGEEIPLCARIVALADVFDALTSKRPYKMPFPHETAKQMILGQSGSHFDPEIVQAFSRREQDFVLIRRRYPDTELPEDKPFELPARDRA